MTRPLWYIFGTPKNKVSRIHRDDISPMRIGWTAYPEDMVYSKTSIVYVGEPLEPEKQNESIACPGRLAGGYTPILESDLSFPTLLGKHKEGNIRTLMSFEEGTDSSILNKIHKMDDLYSESFYRS